ncbi:MAG: hypothetical protein PHD04_00840 [Candidatus Pacebacteria bacterium]|nr:hypothetical protein [Candidatus Paceibacterota bacterium]
MSTEDAVGASLTRSGAQLGNAAADVMSSITAHNNWMTMVKKHQDAEKLGFEIKDNVDLIAEAMQQHPEYDAQYAQDAFDSLSQTIEKQTTDPDVWNAVQGTLDSERHNLLSAARLLERKRLVDEGQAVTERKMEEFTKEWVAEPTEEGKQLIRDKTELFLRSQGAQNIYPAHVVEQMVQKKDAIFEEAEARALFNTDPARLSRELSDKTKFTHLGPIKREEFVSKLKGAVKDQIITSNLIKLKTEFPDVRKRIDYIESTDFLKTLGDEGAEIQNTLLSYSSRELLIKENEYKRMAEQKIGAASVKIYNGQPLTNEDKAGLEPPELALLEKIKDYQGRQDRAEATAIRSEQRMARSEASQRRQEERIARQEKSMALSGGIIAKILSNEPIDIKHDIYAEVPKGLDINEATRLVSMVGKIQGDPKYKLGKDVIEKAFKSGVIDAPTRGKALIDFQQKVEEEGAAGKRIIDIAEEIVTPKKESKVTEWLKNIFSNYKVGMPNVQFDGKVAPSQHDLEFTAKKHGMTVDEVKKRLGI